MVSHVSPMYRYIPFIHIYISITSSVCPSHPRYKLTLKRHSLRRCQPYWMDIVPTFEIARLILRNYTNKIFLWYVNHSHVWERKVHNLTPLSRIIQAPSHFTYSHEVQKETPNAGWHAQVTWTLCTFTRNVLWERLEEQTSRSNALVCIVGSTSRDEWSE